MPQSMLAAVRAAALASTSTAAIAATTQETDMPNSAPAATAAPAPATPAARTHSQADLDAAVAAARNEGFVAGRTEGAAAERARILGIEALAMPGHEKLIADMKADGATTPEQAAVKLIQAEKQAGAQRLGAVARVEATTSVVPAAPSASVAPAPVAQPVVQTADGWKAEFAASPALQEEFGNAETYAAFKQGEASGRVRILRKA